jgi:probable rRNA maturation factor
MGLFLSVSKRTSVKDIIWYIFERKGETSMRLHIDFIDETNEVTEEQMEIIEKLLNYAAAVEQVPHGAEVSISFVDNEQIRAINRDYRGKDKPTDVISFALEEMGDGEVEIVGVDMPPLLGDIIISVPKAKEQAEEYGHSFMRELGFLAVHGFLHLLGYDHETEEEEKEMFAKQKQILEEYGLKR